jgi:hypothetical protein
MCLDTQEMLDEDMRLFREMQKTQRMRDRGIIPYDETDWTKVEVAYTGFALFEGCLIPVTVTRPRVQYVLAEPTPALATAAEAVEEATKVVNTYRASPAFVDRTLGAVLATNTRNASSVVAIIEKLEREIRFGNRLVTPGGPRLKV